MILRFLILILVLAAMALMAAFASLNTQSVDMTVPGFLVTVPLWLIALSAFAGGAVFGMVLMILGRLGSSLNYRKRKTAS